MPIDAFCSGVTLAYFLLGLLLACDAFLTASLASLIAAGLTYAMHTAVHWGLEGCPKVGNTGIMPSRYLCVSMWKIACSKFDVIKISNVKLFVDLIFVRRGIIRNIRTFVPIKNFLVP